MAFVQGLQRFSVLCAAAGFMLAGAAPALGQESEGAVRLSGAVQLGPNILNEDFDALNALTRSAITIAPLARDEIAAAAPIRNRRTASYADDTGSASALPWYERFTVAPAESYAVWGDAPQEFQLEAGDRWGVTLGYSETTRSPQDLSLSDFSAGAFFEFSERVRVGGQLRFTSPEEEIFGEETENKTPELRFESAFRF
jgi:hypothetical protein